MATYISNERLVDIMFTNEYTTPDGKTHEFTRTPCEAGNVRVKNINNVLTKIARGDIPEVTLRGCSDLVFDNGMKPSLSESTNPRLRDVTITTANCEERIETMRDYLKGSSY